MARPMIRLCHQIHDAAFVWRLFWIPAAFSIFHLLYLNTPSTRVPFFRYCFLNSIPSSKLSPTIMYISQIALLTLCLLSSGSSAFPGAPIFDFFADTSIPFLEIDSALSDFNFTTPSEDALGLSKRALQLEFVKYSITIDGRNQNNFENFLVSGPMLVTTGISSPGTTTG